MKDFDRFPHAGVKNELLRLRDALSARNPRLRFGSSGDGEITIKGPNATAYARKYRSRDGWRLALHHDGRRVVSYPATTEAVIRTLHPILASASNEGPPPTERGPRLAGQAGSSKRLGISDPVRAHRIAAASFTRDDNDLQSIVHYWSTQHCIRGRWLHPDDEHVLLGERHSFNLDHPAGQYVGDILGAPVVILGANGRYSSRTPNEFRSQDDIQGFLSRQRDPSNADWGSSLPRYYFNETNYGQWFADGRVALLNACAYRSPKISEEKDNKRAIRRLRSVRFTRSWLTNVLIPLAQGGQRLVVVKRGGLWNLQDLRGTIGVVFDPAPISPRITGEALVEVERWLASTGSRS